MKPPLVLDQAVTKETTHGYQNRQTQRKPSWIPNQSSKVETTHGYQTRRHSGNPHWYRKPPIGINLGRHTGNPREYQTHKKVSNYIGTEETHYGYQTKQAQRKTLGYQTMQPQRKTPYVSKQAVTEVAPHDNQTMQAQRKPLMGIKLEGLPSPFPIFPRKLTIHNVQLQRMMSGQTQKYEDQNSLSPSS